MNDDDEREFESRTCFPNGDAEAYFLPTAQTIYLNNIERETLAQQLHDRDYISARFPLQTIFHEVTHWADVVGTVWGRSFLEQVYEAYGVAEKINAGGQEQFFWKLAALHDVL